MTRCWVVASLAALLAAAGPALGQEKSAEEIMKGLLGDGATSRGIGEVTTESKRVAVPIQFEYNSAEITAESMKQLEVVARVLGDDRLRRSRIRVEGHTDKSGSLKYNMILSKKRANTVVRYLVGRGQVSRSRLVPQGFGPKKPLYADPKSKEEAALNRRVEFHIVQKAEPKE